MRIVVVGATGRTGLRVVDAACALGADVLAIVRDPDKLAGRRVPFACGDVRDPVFLRGVLRADDVVISTLGNTRGAGQGDAVGHGTEQLVAAMESVGARRLLGVVGAGVLLSESGVPRHTLPSYPAALRPIGAAHQAALAACERSTLSWVLVGCPRIVDADATGRTQIVIDHLPPGLDVVTTGDLAEFLVREAQRPTVSRGRVGVNQIA